MCEQTEVVYLEGDIVWVKLGPAWWPGEVMDFEKMEEDVKRSFKKPPIAIVKFFEEDKYEYVKNISNIYKYNCRRKNDFIKKGLDLHRKDNAFMTKFPSDVVTAEMRTDGDPDILSSEEFSPEERATYSNIFGYRKPPKQLKQTARMSTGGKAVRPFVHGRNVTTTNEAKRISHPRFIGKSDYEVTYLEQKKKEDEETQPAQTYTCHICGFKSNRLNVIVLHNKSHLNYWIPNVPIEKTPVKVKPRRATKSKFANTSSIDEDIQLFRQGYLISDSSEPEDEETVSPKKQKTQKHQKTPKSQPKSQPKTNKEKEKSSPSAICNNLLADWGDSDTDEPEEKQKENIENPAEKQKENIEELEEKQKENIEKSKDVIKEFPTEQHSDKTNENGKDCFDFKEEEENTVLQKSPGRKIPRVIPQKRKSTEISKNIESEIPTNSKQDESKNDFDESFKSLLEETSVPDLPVLDSLKSVQNFQLRKPIKSPDKKDEGEKTNGVFKESESVSECPIPKKRFVRNFEDFEQFVHDHKSNQTSSKEESPSTSPSKSSLEVSKLKSQLMTKLQESTPVDKPKRGRRKTKHVEKKEEIEDIETRKESKEIEDTSMEEIIVNAAEVTQLIESKEDNNSLYMSESSQESSLQEKSDFLAREMDKLPDITHIEMDSSSKDTLEEEKQDLSQSSDEILRKDTPIFQERAEEMEVQSQHKAEDLHQHEIFQKSPSPQEIPQGENVVPEDTIVSQEENNMELEKPQEKPMIAQEDSTIVQEEFNIIQEQPVIVQDKSTIAQEETSIAHEETSIAQEETSNAQEETSIAQEETFIVQEETPIAQEETSIVQEEPPIVQEKTPIVQEETATVQEETMIAQEETMIAQDETLIAHEDSMTIHESTIVQENMFVEEAIVHEEHIAQETIQDQIMQEDKHEPIEESKSKIVMDINDIHIDNIDNLSGLTTLAAVSAVFDAKQHEIVIEETIADTKEKIQEIAHKSEEIPLPTSPKKVATLANFSMDFSDSNESLPIKKSESQEVVIEESVTEMTIANVQSEIGKASQFPPFNFMAEENLQEKIPEKPGTLESEMAKLTNTHPGSEEVLHETQNTSSSKLLEILTETKGSKKMNTTQKNIIQDVKQRLLLKRDKSFVKMDKSSKFVIKSTKTPSKSNKPIILSEKIIKPVTETETVSVKKVTSKRNYQDVEDIDTFIIQKPSKKSNTDDMHDIVLTPKSEIKKLKKSNTDEMHDIILTPKSEVKQIRGRSGSTRGKPKIIEQTIIKAADIPTTSESPLLDDNMFDINSMPIVLSDQILTPESIEKMPVITDMIPSSSIPSPSIEKTSLKRGGTLQQVKILNKPKIVTSQPEPSPKIQAVVKNIMPKGLGKNQKVYASSTKLLKNNPAVITQPGKPGKFIILPTTTASTTTGSKYTVGKRLAMKSTETPTKLKPIQGLSNEPSGNKIMIVTNNQGVQSRVLLTPAQQKMLAGKVPVTKITKNQSQIKGNILHPKSILTSKGTLVPSSTMATPQKQLIITSKGQLIQTQGQTLVTSEGQVLTPLTPQQLKNIKSDSKRRLQRGRLILSEPDKMVKKTILLKGGQTYKKVTTTPETKSVIMPVQKQLVSLSSQPGISGKQLLITSKGQVIKTEKMLPKMAEKVNIPKVTKAPTSRSSKKQMLLTPKNIQTSSANLPPLAPITPMKKVETVPIDPKPIPEIKDTPQSEQKHLIIQDNMGNQTTVTEGQILALPRETVDGQPQSYMLVTVDESGNLQPLSNEALMSLDPNLSLGGDMNNLVLQINDPGATESQAIEKPQEIQPEPEQQIVLQHPTEQIMEQPVTETYEETIAQTTIAQETMEQQTIAQTMVPEQQTLACNISTGDTGQQLIITGDPESTQKFLASLSSNTDLSSLLTGAEGNIIINTDGQQILLNTGDPENQILLNTVDSENQILLMPSEMNQGAIYDPQIKNQDILAAALAGTDVFQQETDKNQDIKTSQLSPSSGLYAMNVGSVLETSLTLGSPIMTPLEIPSSNKKIKHDIESTLSTQVPSSLELPITITDPNISQTVSQQILLSNELQSNLVLPISVSDTITSIQSSEMNSPNYIYSLPSLEESAEIETKTVFSENNTTISAESIYNNLTGSMSMPLLTEEPDMQIETDKSYDTEKKLLETEEVSHGAEIVPEVLSDVTPEITPEIPQMKTEIVPEVTPEILQTETEFVPEVTPEIPQMESEFVSETTPEIPQMESEFVAEVTPEISQTERDLVPEVTPQMERVVTPEIPQIEKEIVPEVTPEVPQMENVSEVTSEISQMEKVQEVMPEIPQMENVSELTSEIPQMESGIVPEVKPEIPQMESAVGPEVTPDIPQMESLIVPEVTPEMPQMETEIESEIQVPEVTPEISQMDEIVTEITPDIPQEIVETKEQSVEEFFIEEPPKTFSETIPTDYPEGRQKEDITNVSHKVKSTLEISEREMQEDMVFQNNDDLSDSLSEPPPGMFEKNFLEDTYLNKEETNLSDIPLPDDDMPLLENNKNDTNVANMAELDNNMTVESEVNSELSNLEINSPRLDIDEGSCEIPVQPAIVANLTDTLVTEFEDSRKRECDEIEDVETKRTKLSD